MIKKIRLPFNFTFILIVLSACHDTDSALLKGCCGNEPIWDTFGNAKIYVPNLFTPNGDGLNDRFFIRGDSIHQIILLEVRNRLDQLVFDTRDVLFNGPDDRGWDGKVKGNYEKGLYSFTLDVEGDDGTIRHYDGKVCNYPCGLMNEFDLIPRKGCHFDSEWDCWMYEDGCQNLDLPECFK